MGRGPIPFLGILGHTNGFLGFFLIESCRVAPISRHRRFLVWLKCFFFSSCHICIFPFYCLSDRGNDNTKRVLDMYFIIYHRKKIMFAASDTTNEMDSIFTQWNNEAPKIAILRSQGTLLRIGRGYRRFTFHSWTHDEATAAPVISCMVYWSFVAKAGRWVHFFCRSSLNSSSFLVDPFPIGLKHVFTMFFFVGRFVRDDWYVLCIGDYTCPFPWTSVCSACHLQHCFQRRTSSIGSFQLEKKH